MPAADQNRPFEVRRVVPFDVDAVRELRLEALRRHPESFDVDLELWDAYRPGWWTQFVREAAFSERIALFLAETATGPTGLASVRRLSDLSTSYECGMLFVRPEFRHGGTARALTDARAAWALAQGATELVAWIVDGNLASEHAHRTMGWERSDATLHTSRGDLEHQWVLRLNSTSSAEI